MKLTEKYKPFLKRALQISGLWVCVAVLISSITFLNQLQGNYPEELSIFMVLLFETICISPWAVSTPFIVRIARRYSFDENQRYKSIFVHLLTALVVFCFHSVIQSLAVSWFYHEPLTLSYLWLDFRGFLDMRLMLYTGLLLGIYAIDLQKKNREIMMREPRLRAQLNNARYRALLNQVQPGFLLDSIDSIDRNLPDDPKAAEHILIDLSDLLRIMLRNIDQDEVSIQEDLESFHLYVDILKGRYSTDIRKETHIDPECYDVCVPSFLIFIPIVENLIGKASRTHYPVKSISYAVERVGSEIRLKVIIAGLPEKEFKNLDRTAKKKLAQIKERLQDKYGQSVELISKTAGSEVAILLQIPNIGKVWRAEPVRAGFTSNPSQLFGDTE